MTNFLPTNIKFLLTIFVFFVILKTVNAGVSGPIKPPSTLPYGPANGINVTQNIKLQSYDYSFLNLKAEEVQNNVSQLNSAISLNEIDFNTFTAVGNSWLIYINTTASLSMNIGTANNSTSQAWTLPTNFYTFFEGAGRSDFIATASVPAGLTIAGANKVSKTEYLDSDMRPLQVYNHYFVGSNSIDHLGLSYDLEVGDDDNFDEPDYEVTDVPLDLNDTWSATVEEHDYISNLTLTKYVRNTSVNGFGTFTTPDGIFNCLRLITNKQIYTRPNESTAYSLVSTSNEITFLSKEGIYFNAETSALNGTVNLTNFSYRIVVPTALLTENNEVSINNNSHGVTINVDNSKAHPSAILDVKNDSLGILIPRIAKANRPNSPATGLLVYQIDNTPGFYYFDGTSWRILSSSPSASLAVNESNAVLNSEVIISKVKGKSSLLNGSIFVKYAQNLKNWKDVSINLQLEENCNGLYISKKTAEGFEVKELNNGKSAAKFSYTIE